MLKFIKDQKGIAMLEALPIIWVMFVLLGATLGSWGIAHTAILNSIAARNYVFFLFNNRSDLSYLRDFGRYDYNSLSNYKTEKIFYAQKGERFSYITSEKDPGGGLDPMATQRRGDFRNPAYHDRSGFLSDSDHSRIHDLIPERNTQKKVGPAWIMIGYGICLNAKCGN